MIVHYENLLVTFITTMPETRYRNWALRRLTTLGLSPEFFRRKVDPRKYSDPQHYWVDRSIYDLCRKAPIPFLGIDREEKARQQFFDSERLCAKTNRYFRRLLDDNRSDWTIEEMRVRDFFERVKNDVSKLLGPLPGYITPRFSSGATVSDPSSRTTILDKLSSRPTLYPGSVCLNELWSQTSWPLALIRSGLPSQPLVVRYNTFFTVPKNWDVDRGCAKEASMPLAYQLGLSFSFLRAKLRAWKIDLAYGAKTHNALARAGSLYGTYATIDLEQASNTIARMLVRACVPEHWYILFASLRAPCTLMNGKSVYLEKFSSMGNGFTFELETIIFAAIVRRVVLEAGGNPDSVRVYGDDIIVPTEYAADVQRVLVCCGFLINHGKTYTQGPFRESCGGDYFAGQEVATVKMSKFPEQPSDWIALYNRVVEVTRSNSERRKIVAPFLAHIVAQLPSDIRDCTGPSWLGDVCLHTDERFWNIKTRFGRNTGEHSLLVKTLVPLPRRVPLVRRDGTLRWKPDVILAALPLGGFTPHGVVPRDSVSGHTIKWVPITGVAWLPDHMK